MYMHMYNIYMLSTYFRVYLFVALNKTATNRDPGQAAAHLPRCLYSSSWEVGCPTVYFCLQGGNKVDKTVLSFVLSVQGKKTAVAETAGNVELLSLCCRYEMERVVDKGEVNATRHCKGSREKRETKKKQIKHVRR